MQIAEVFALEIDNINQMYGPASALGSAGFAGPLTRHVKPRNAKSSRLLQQQKHMYDTESDDNATRIWDDIFNGFFCFDFFFEIRSRRQLPSLQNVDAWAS
jgi:hypothetical protein